MLSKQRSTWLSSKRRVHGNQYRHRITGHPWNGTELANDQSTLPRSSSAQKLVVLQPEPAVGDKSQSGYRLFYIQLLVEFVEQFPCPICADKNITSTTSRYINCLFTLNPLLLHSRGVDEEGSQSLTHVILRPISQILVNVTLKLVNACGYNSTSRKSIPIVYYPLSERVLSYIKPRV